MGPFQNLGHIQRYRSRLNMETAFSNLNGKIWLFFDAVVEWELVTEIAQQVTVRVFHHDLGQHILMTFVYAKCSSVERLELWDSLYYLESDMELPWLVGGDFNVVLHEDEKIGGRPVYPSEYGDFAFCHLFTTTEVEHLIRTGTDHAPLLMTCGEQTTNFVKPFKFLNFWTKHATFNEMVRQNWNADFIGDPFLILKHKLKKQLAILEDIVNVKEMLFEEEPTIENIIVLQKAQAELKKYFSIKDQYWKQKAGMTWFAEGDRNTNFFHIHINEKRKKLQMERIQNGDGNWLEDQEQMANAAIEFYQRQFTNKGNPTNFSMLENLPTIVTLAQNLELCRFSTLEEVRVAIFKLSGDSASGSDGFTGLFYQECWKVISYDMHNMILHFYGGAPLPKSITHTNLVFLPKKPRVQTFSDLRPISLSNFINKVLSRVIHDKLEQFLPSLICPNQSRFVKGRSIFENILLTQEIVADIRLRGKPANVIIKLDMAKAYDRVSWKYLLHIIRRMGFAERFINMVWNMVSNNWYSVLVNGKPSCFFKSTRFGMPKWSDLLNHLAYADDTIIFALAHPPSLSKIMAILGRYEQVSGQLINKAKRSYYMHANVAHALFQRVGDITGFAQGEFPFTYLGCPIFYNRRRKDYYDDLVKKIKAKLHSWKGKLLSFGGKATLITRAPKRKVGADIGLPGRIYVFLKKKVVELRQEGIWNEHLVDQSFTEEIAEHIIQNVQYGGSEEFWDKPYWMPTTSGKFTLGSSWHILRHRAHPNQEFKNIWIKGLPFKILFFLWRLWRRKVATDDLWRRQGYIVMSRCWCCHHPQEETIDHIFLTSPIANKEAPAITTWEWWKRRNTGKYGGTVSTSRVIHEVNKILHYLARMRYPWLSNMPLIWPDMIIYLEGYKPILVTRTITWQAPYAGWFKCNTDEASKGNPGPSSLGFCVRNKTGDLVYARSVDLRITTNVVAEAKYIVQGLEYCMEQGLHPLILETDSLLMKKVIEGEWDPPWSLVEEVKKIKEI
ncbi:uncharacterized protein [Nicotiana tomentosiformis]|uniref:uncharacterized protein n=1 Tax=Nicotiana tomentosiformis TaxID=4098 RepID=UPI00388C3AC5